MNTPRFVTLSRLVLTAGLVLAAAAAQAGGRDNVYWSVNVDAPMQGAGRVSTSFSNTRQGMYRDQAPVMMYGAPPPVVYAPAPVVIPGRVMYPAPAYGYGYGPGFRPHHHHRGPRMAARVVRNVHRGLARMHEDMANFHASRADAWGGGRRYGYGYGYDD
ncbi:MAG: hypothetical protein QM742_01120 [Aquabacterium sp.]